MIELALYKTDEHGWTLHWTSGRHGVLAEVGAVAVGPVYDPAHPEPPQQGSDWSARSPQGLYVPGQDHGP